MLFKCLCHSFISIIISLLLFGCSTPKTQPSSGLKQDPVFNMSEFIADDGYRLPFRLSWPVNAKKGIVVALHGFNDYSKAFDRMCDHFVLNGYACLAYDQRGFGDTNHIGIWPTTGRLQQDLFSLVEKLRKKYPQQPVFLVGESMGGAVILTAMSDAELPLSRHVEGVILYAPAVWARSTQPWYQRLSLWLAVHIFPDWSPTGEGLGVQATDNIDALREMGRDKKVIKATRIDAIYGLTNLMDAALLGAKSVSIPTLVLYGDNDEVIPKKPTCEMLAAMRSDREMVSFIHYENGYHMLSRDLQSARVFEDSITWMDTMRVASNSKIDLLKLRAGESVNYCIDN